MIRILDKLKLVLLARFKPTEFHAMLVVAAVIGLLGAVATIGFREALGWLEHAFFGRGGGLVAIAEGLPWWQRLIAPALGGMCAGVLLQIADRKYDTAVEGDYMEAIALGEGRVHGPLSLLKAASSALTVASGGSIGREGPMVQLSALVGSVVGRLRPAPKPTRRLMVACGAAAGITAAYNAPIAGALFVSEIVLRSIAIDSLAPLLVASVAAHLTAHRILGYGPVYLMPPLGLDLAGDAPSYVALGLLAGLLAPLFLRLLELARAAFFRLHLPTWLTLGVGGLVVGAISIAAPQVWGNGYSVVNSILQGGWSWQALLAILCFKLLATAATTGSGAVGGVFTPTLFVGAAVGALFGTALQLVWPSAIPITAFAAVGMGAFLSATTHAPLTATLMIFEMTGNYDVIVPLVIACVLAFTIARALLPRSVYARSLPPPDRSAFASLNALNVLRTDPPTVVVGQPVGQLEREFLRHRWQHVYVVDDEHRFLGAISLHDFGPYLRSRPDAQAPLPLDLLRRDYPRLATDASLGNALEVFARHAGERLPVVARDGRLRGFVAKTDLMLILGESAAAA